MRWLKPVLRERLHIYNPIFRIRSNWITPVEITNNQTLTLEDFDESGIIYYYDIPDNNGISVGSQRIYLTCYNKPESNYWQQNWPLPGSGEISAGLLIWRENRNLNPFFTSNYEDALYMPIDIEATHGKWKWNNLDLSEAPPADLKPINSGIADPLFGRDSLETHNTYYYLGFVGYNDTTGEAEYEGEPVYADWRVGSESCFYSPFNSAREYAFYTNPNSCGKTIETFDGIHSNSVSSGFKLENIRSDNNNILVDVKLGVDANVIKQNTTLTPGKWYFYNDVTVAAGVNFTLEGSLELIFENGSQLIVNGTLNTQGTSENPIIFDFISRNSSTQNGIIVNSSGDLTVNNSVIKNAYWGIYSDAAAPDIQNSEIYNCEYGLYIKNSNTIYADPIIYDNKIHNNGSMGVYLSNSYARIKGNEIYDHSNYGVVAYNGSSPDFGWPAVAGNNNIHNNRNGLYAHNSSIPFLGRESCTLQGGDNILASNYVYNIKAYNNDYITIYAENNWWGYSTPDPNKIWISTGGSIDYLPALSSPPALNKIQPTSPEEKDFDEQFNDGVQLVLQPDNAASSNYDEKWILDWKILYVRNLNWAGKFETSKKICEEVIVNNLDSAKVKQFLYLYLYAARKTKEISAYKSFVNNLLPAKNEISKEIEASILLTLNNLETDPSLQISTYDLIDNKFTNHSVAENAIYQKFEHFYFDKNDKEKAAKVYEKMKTKYPDSYLLEFFELALNSETKDNNEKYINENNEDYQLIGNYPNPSNPATTIKYSLPYASNVKIEIFDITGSRIRTFDIPAQSAGIQKVSWDGLNSNGTSVASGIYIYRFSAVPVGNTGKEFVKSAKIMLLK